jgi:hypothetical protein
MKKQSILEQHHLHPRSLHVPSKLFHVSKDLFLVSDKGINYLYKHLESILDIIILTVNNTDINEKHHYQNRLRNIQIYYLLCNHPTLLAISHATKLANHLSESLIAPALISLDYILLVEGGVGLYKH